MQRYLSGICALALFGICVLAYWPGLHGGFLFDDYRVIANNQALRAIGTSGQSWIGLVLSSDSGQLRRPLSMLSFGLNAVMFGMDPFAFKLVNLGIHLLNGLLVYAIARRLAAHLTDPGAAQVPPERLGLLAAALWLLHPLNISGVLYVVQRMNELASLFTLIGLLCYIEGRLRMLRGEAVLMAALTGLCLFGLLAVLSKENGALITAYAFVVELFAFRFAAPARKDRRILVGFYALLLGLPVALFAVSLIVDSGAWLNYQLRDFTLYERLLSEARILCDYLSWIVVPDTAWMGFYHDDIATSTGLFHPISTFFAIAFLVAVVAVAWKGRKRHPGFAFGVAWFLIGQSMESTILPLELVFEHRNYLPMAGLLLGLVCTIVPWLRGRLGPRWGAIGGVALVFGLALLTAQRAIAWGNPLTLALTEVRNHPTSSRSQYEAGRNIILAAAQKNPLALTEAENKATPFLERSAMLDRGKVIPQSALVTIRAKRGPVPHDMLDDLERRIRGAKSNTDFNAVMDMLVAASMQKQALTPDDVSGVVAAALANRNAPTAVRAMIMNNYGSYLRSRGDLQGAIKWMLAADAEDTGNAYFQLNLAVVAISASRPDKALEYLATARQYDRNGRYAKEIAGLQEKLTKIRGDGGN